MQNARFQIYTGEGKGKTTCALGLALRGLGYDRFLTIEREISGPQQKADILRAKAYIEALLAQA